MDFRKITEELLEAKRKMKLTFADLGKIILRDEVWVAALFYGQASASYEEADKIVSKLGVNNDITDKLTRCPSKGFVKGLETDIPSDPLVYRFYEIMKVYGMPMKEIIHEKFGDGIMSAINFTLKIDKEKDLNGDRVKIIMSGKFLPYKKW